MGQPGRMERGGRASQSRAVSGGWPPLQASGVGSPGAVSQEPCERQGQGELCPLALVSIGQSLPRGVLTASHPQDRARVREQGCTGSHRQWEERGPGQEVGGSREKGYSWAQVWPQ